MLLSAIYHATLQEQADFLSLQHDVAAQMPSGLFAPDDGEYFCKVVAGKGHVLMVRDGMTLIASCMLHFVDADASDNLGFDLGFSLEQRQHVAHLEMLFVRPGYQGKGLATQVLDAAITLATEQGRPEILATVHPDNAASLRVFKARSFVECGFAYKYDNLPRCILRYLPRATETPL